MSRMLSYIEINETNKGKQNDITRNQRSIR